MSSASVSISDRKRTYSLTVDTYADVHISIEDLSTADLVEEMRERAKRGDNEAKRFFAFEDSEEPEWFGASAFATSLEDARKMAGSAMVHGGFRLPSEMRR
jgi:hypothetical protein